MIRRFAIWLCFLPCIFLLLTASRLSHATELKLAVPVKVLRAWAQILDCKEPMKFLGEIVRDEKVTARYLDTRLGNNRKREVLEDGMAQP
jgi:hypothetical protein